MQISRTKVLLEQKWYVIGQENLKLEVNVSFLFGGKNKIVFTHVQCLQKWPLHNEHK